MGSSQVQKGDLTVDPIKPGGIHELIRDTLLSLSETENVPEFLDTKDVSRSFDEEKYHQRNKVETVFSVVKKKVR